LRLARLQTDDIYIDIPCVSGLFGHSAVAAASITGGLHVKGLVPTRCSRAMKSAIILAGGRSRRLGKDKGLLFLGGKTLIEKVYERIDSVAEEVVIAVHTERQKRAYSRLIGNCYFSVDESSYAGPLSGLSSGLKNVTGEKVAVVGCDMPFISPELMQLLYELSREYDASIPRWPSGYIEPLHAVYDTDSCRTAVHRALRRGRSDMRSMISALPRIIYVSTEAIRRLDPNLKMFTNINTRSDLLCARRLLRS
jgi:molybdopterin-guanine dinucleotide biosynthesis protein A